MIKVSDYIIQRLHKVHGINHIFMISGGGAMHLDDSIGKCKGLNYICNHHEQACAIAAEGYARISGKLAAVNVTTGPGGTNTLTGVFGQWTDSVPVIYISGQVKEETTINAYPELKLRQLGDQEVNIVEIVKPITKFAVSITDPLDVKKLLDKAVYIATHGRPGPVWLDVPMNVQGAMIEEDKLNDYNSKEDETVTDVKKIQSQVGELVEMLKTAERPVFLAGNGIRIAGAQDLFLEIILKLGIPVVSSFNGCDLITTNNPLYIGRVGTIGDRAGNFALQNSDLLLCVGTRNNIRQISYNWQSFARNAKKVVVDIDSAELKKPTLIPDLAINSDAKYFLEVLKSQLAQSNLSNRNFWNNWCLERKKKYPVVLPEYEKNNELVQPYYFAKVLTECMQEGDIAVTGNATVSICMFQAAIVKKNQRLLWNSGCASMGYDLSASIGACISTNCRPVICLAGDGSLQFNLQELQTVLHYKLPIKIFYFNNNGYTSIQQTQDSHFEGRRVASGPDSGVSFPDIIKIAKAYGLPVEVLDSHQGMREKIQRVLNTDGPIMCEVKLTPDYKFSPKLSSQKLPDGRMVSRPLEDLFPFLDREELKKNMLIPLLED